MDSPSEITPIALYGSGVRPNTLVVKDIPTEVDRDQIVTYLENVCHDSVTAIYFPPTCGIAVVILENKVSDLSSFDEKEVIPGCQPSIESLDRARGVFLYDLPEGLSIDFILKRLGISKKSGRKEAAVDETESQLYRRGDGKYYGRIIITDYKMLDKILFDNNAHEILDGIQLDLNVEPYYPCIHDYLLEIWEVNECTSTDSTISESEEDVSFGLLSPTPQSSEPTNISATDIPEQFIFVTSQEIVPSTELQAPQSRNNRPILPFRDPPQLNADNVVPVKPFSFQITENTADMLPPGDNAASIESWSSPKPYYDQPKREEKEYPSRRECKVKGEKSKKIFKLEGAKAACFQKFFQIHIENSIRDQHGKIDVRVLNGKFPLKLEIDVEGTEAVLLIVTSCVKGMKPHALDFSKISTDPDDLRLMMEGLDMKQGKQFLHEFQKCNDCYIDVIKNGEVPMSSVETRKVDAVADSSSESSDDSESDTCWKSDLDRDDGAVCGAGAYSDTGTRWKHKGHIHLLQGDMPEKKAFRMALEASRNDAPQNSMGAASFDDPREKMSSNYEWKQKQHAHDLHVKERSDLEYKLDNLKVILRKGKISDQKVDCIVNMVSPDWGLFKTSVSRAIVQRAGKKLEELYQVALKHCRRRRSMSVVTGGGNLNCSQVVHLRLKEEVDDCSESIDLAVKDIRRVCQDNRLSSVAMPPLGVGRVYDYPASDSVESVLKAIQRRFLDTSIKTVYIVIFDKDSRSTHLEFKKKCDEFFMLKSKKAYFHEIDEGFPSKHRSRQQRHKDKSSDKRFDTRKYESTESERMTGHQNRERKTQYSEKPSGKLVFNVFSKDNTEEARNKLEKRIEEKFLMEKQVKRSYDLPGEAKAKLDRIKEGKVVRYKKGKDQYTIRGFKEDVEATCSEVQNVLLQYASESHRSRRERRKKTRKNKQEFLKLMATEDPDVPEYWKNYHPGESIMNVLRKWFDVITKKKYYVIELDHRSREFKGITQMILETFSAKDVGMGNDAKGLKGYNTLKVIKIERIENLELYKKYAVERSDLFGRCLRNEGFKKVHELRKSTGRIKTTSLWKVLPEIYQEVNEYYLFHGTKLKNVDAICHDGCDEKLCGENAMFGRGIYGAESSTKADQYADDEHSRSSGPGHQKKMFLIRMLLGDSFICTEKKNPLKYKRGPCKGLDCYSDTCTEHKERFDSVIGDNGKLFREFVVYNKSQCYPEYLITYERIYK